jgi:hypothetical protein
MSKFSTPNINDFVNNQITSYNKIPDEDLNFQPYTEQQLDPIARMAKNSYQDPNKRQDVGNYKYLQDESTDDLAVYENDDEYHISIRGTSPKTFVRDLIKDTGIALGTLGTPIFNRAFDQDIENVQNKINKFKIKKPVSISGHSKGGSVAGFVGVDNPDVRVTTFNRGDALPFVGDYIKCAINGCENINNYRISGDTAGLVGSKFSNQRYFNLKPRKATEEMKETSEQLKTVAGKLFDYTDTEDFYLPHTIDNFYDRKQGSILNHDTYARPLSKKIGNYGLVTGAAIASYGYKKYLELYKKKRLMDTEIQQYIDFGGDPASDYDFLQGRVEAITQNLNNRFRERSGQIAGATVLGGTVGLGQFMGETAYDLAYGLQSDKNGEDEL